MISHDLNIDIKYVNKEKNFMKFLIINHDDVAISLICIKNYFNDFFYACSS